MARQKTGAVVERETKAGKIFALRFSAAGARRYYTLGSDAEGWTREKAEEELANVLADVRRGIWQPPREEGQEEEAERLAPTFRAYSADWLTMREPELAESSVDRMKHDLRHLNAAFGDMRLDQITISDVDQYRAAKLREGRLGADSINKNLKLMAQILDYALEDDEWVTRNVARGKRRRVPNSKRKPRRTWLNTADQIAALLDATNEIDRRGDWETFDRAILGTLMFAGLRIGELTNLRRRDVDLPSGRITVTDSKTEAGERQINILPPLRDYLSAYVAERKLKPGAYLFGTGTGERYNESNIRSRLLAPAVKAANRNLEERGLATMSERITPHSLRHTFCSILFALGEDAVYVMGQLGHTDAAFTLRVYAHAMSDRSGERERIAQLVNGEPLDADAAAEASTPAPDKYAH